MAKAILFDLDGTLLPMDNDEFTKTYFYLLSEAAKEWGYTDRDELIKAVWGGVKYMYMNDGSVTNDKVFWKGFSKALGRDCSNDSAKFDTYYYNGFKKAQVATKENPQAIEVIKLAHEKADFVILATNPIFPLEAYRERLRWIGLSLSDFDIVTDYESCHFTKPHTAYYEEILSQIGVKPHDALMIGNDCDEDMVPALKLGMDFFLVDDCLLNKSDLNIECKRGSFADMTEYLRGL